MTEVQFQSPPPGGRAGPGNAAAVSASGAPIAAPPGFPRGFKVETSTDGSSWTVVSEGAGTGLTTISTFPPVPAKFVRITLTAGADDAPAWSIQSLKIYAVQSPDKRPSGSLK